MTAVDRIALTLFIFVFLGCFSREVNRDFNNFEGSETVSFHFPEVDQQKVVNYRLSVKGQFHDTLFIDLNEKYYREYKLVCFGNVDTSWLVDHYGKNEVILNLTSKENAKNDFTLKVNL